MHPTLLEDRKLVSMEIIKMENGILHNRKIRQLLLCNSYYQKPTNIFFKLNKQIIIQVAGYSTDT